MKLLLSVAMLATVFVALPATAAQADDGLSKPDVVAPGRTLVAVRSPGV